MVAASRRDIEAEHKGLSETTPADAVHIGRQIAKATAKNKRRKTVHTVIVDIGARDVTNEEFAALQRYNDTAERRIGELWLLAQGTLRQVLEE
ncbi:hypothetical protein [Nakamurella aerolata]|uniref:Uncharacterized protein n=1 Tax=Nakamurella aerolata TaxID=1656892 RepID=A0A849ABH3_9ACTN|nr:hypothetical protein [Nakamurella aerolata]NNG36936.1 hypothetical protein [Nakamurella aerolata]